MKKITLALSAILMLFVSYANAQQSVLDNLDETVDAAETIRVESKKVKAALKVLTIDYIINNNSNPNVTTYLQVMDRSMEVVEEYSDEVNSYIGDAAQENNKINPASIQSKASQIEGNEDFVRNKSAELQTAIQQNNRALSYQLIHQIKRSLETQIKLAKEIKQEATDFKAVATVYNVRIKLVDQSGASVPADTLPGYGAKNLETGVYIYPDYYDYNTFKNLPAGTYRFSAYDGYFDGASDAVVTLDPSLVGADGFIDVTLHYWSE